MKNSRLAIPMLAIAVAVFATLVLQISAFAQGTAFTYNGRLNDGASPANGNYDLTFSLWNAASGPTQTGGTLTNTATAISNGLFTVTLDFGNQFPGADRWLEIAVRTNGGGDFTNLSPRQPITSTPYAVQALGAGSAASYSGAISDGQLSANIARLNGSNVFSGAVQFINTSNSFTGGFTGSGAGVTNVSFGTLSAPGVLAWPGNFVLVSSPGVGISPRSVVAADVNGDGKLDLITANSDGSLTILTNNGGGGFVASSTNAVGSNPRSVVAADVNADGKLDLICASQSPGTLRVLTNNGSGGFVPASTNSTGAGAGNVQMVVAADVNGDGKPDLISANGNSSPGTLSVFTNAGSGGFVFSSTNSVANNPFAVTAADVNGDGKIDLISANSTSPGTLIVLTNNGNGDGGFVPASTNSVGNNPRSVTAADVNGDGKLDLISANNTVPGTLSVLTNTGSGGFVSASTNSVGDSPLWVTAVDLNGDGKVDLISANSTSPGTLTALTNNGSGSFALAFTSSVGNNPSAVIAADVNGDSKVDLVSVNQSPGTLSVLFNVPTFTGSGAGLFNISADAITGGLTTNLTVLLPGPKTNTLSFINGILRAVQ